MAGSVITYLDAYCERAGDAGIFGEPLNLFTNVLFMIAAILSAEALLKRNGQGRRTDLWLLTAIMFSIGIGSGLWHLNPTQVTLLLDVIPITLFIWVFIISALRRLFGLPWGRSWAWFAAYFTFGIVAQYTLPPELFNGSVMYLPTYLTLALMTYLLHKRDAVIGKDFTIALAVWTASLVFRTIDMEACPTIHVGTHFLWHTLNAFVLWKLLGVLIRHQPVPVKR